MKKNIKYVIILLVIILITFPTTFYLKYQWKYILADIKYPIKEINIDFFNAMDVNDLNNILLITKNKKIRYYDINKYEYSYYKDRIWWDIKRTNNISELTELKELMINNSLIWIYQKSWNEIFFDYWDEDFELWYIKNSKVEIWNILKVWRVEKIINENWFIIRKCNEYICKDSF